ncbi:hypothetical protein QBZ16_004719 [Prototheca wickerhamii]|uniref:Uncharacterized protein n=1 Tax=Prototheca wickerhamii TaxID=3111 RepID=A0AAD9MJU9_PROWI|nr:hypothetical protein QBZ16_004719 [Prototheca wickerhamii]
MLGRLGFNALAAVTLGATALLGAYLPVLLSSRDKLQGGSGRSVAYILGNMLSAGVMVSAGFCHLLGDAISDMPEIAFPLAPFLCGVGFILTLICDAAATRAASRSVDAVALSSCHLHRHDLDRESDADAASLQQRHASEKAIELDGVHEVELGSVEDGRPAGAAEGAPLLAAGARASAALAGAPSVVLGAPPSHAPARHVPAGAAMGAQLTVGASMHIFIAIVSHKGLAAYALGSSIVDSGASAGRFWAVVGPFAVASPAGIFVGYVISDLTAGAGAASISALAAGTFLYVAFMEVIPKELHTPGHTAAKLAMLVLGFGLMSMLAIWA